MLVNLVCAVECEDGADWVKQCMTIRIDGAGQEGLSEEDLVGLC